MIKVGEFQPKKNYKVSRNLAENYKSRQNTANPNISRIYGSAGFILKNRLGSLSQQLFIRLSWKFRIPAVADRPARRAASHTSCFPQMWMGVKRDKLPKVVGRTSTVASIANLASVASLSHWASTFLIWDNNALLQSTGHGAILKFRVWEQSINIFGATRIPSLHWSQEASVSKTDSELWQTDRETDGQRVTPSTVPL